MHALKWARKLLKKEQAEIDERYRPITPLPEEPKQLNVKPMEASAPTPLVITVERKTAIENAIQKLREQTTKL